jgi:hypothetical protein
MLLLVAPCDVTCGVKKHAACTGGTLIDGGNEFRHSGNSSSDCIDPRDIIVQRLVAGQKRQNRKIQCGLMPRISGILLGLRVIATHMQDQ